LTLDNSEIVEYVEGYEKEITSLRTNALKITWYMRGGVSYEDVMMLSSSERDIINALIKENLETTKKSGLPFF
jgi:hypothetical protein